MNNITKAISVRSLAEMFVPTSATASVPAARPVDSDYTGNEGAQLFIQGKKEDNPLFAEGLRQVFMHVMNHEISTEPAFADLLIPDEVDTPQEEVKFLL